MERNRNGASALSVQLSWACLFCTAVFWFSEGGPGLVFPLLLIPYAPALYGLNQRFLRRERSVRALVLLNAAAGLVLFAVLAADIGLDDWQTLAAAAFFCICLTAQGAGMALEPPALPRMVLCLDGSILVLILTAATSSTGRAPLCQIAVACMGCASALLGLIVRRTGGNLGARGWAFLGAAFLGILALMFLLVGTAAAPAGRGILALWDVLTAAAQALAALFWRILVWVLTLFPAPENSVEGNPAAAPVEMPEELEELGPSPVAMLVLIVLLAVSVVWLAVWGLRMLGRFRIGGRAAARTVRTERERLSLLQALRRLLASWAAYVRGRVWLARSRNTPDGLFFLLVRRCRMGPWHKRPGETPREFLLRLRRSAEGDPQLAGALDELIPAVDAALYAPKGRSGRFSRARLVRRRVGAAVRRQFLRDSWDRMPWRKERDGGAN